MTKIYVNLIGLVKDNFISRSINTLRVSYKAAKQAKAFRRDFQALPISSQLAGASTEIEVGKLADDFYKNNKEMFNLYPNAHREYCLIIQEYVNKLRVQNNTLCYA